MAWVEGAGQGAGAGRHGRESAGNGADLRGLVLRNSAGASESRFFSIVRKPLYSATFRGWFFSRDLRASFPVLLKYPEN